jgi:hypothetical protein
MTRNLDGLAGAWVSTADAERDKEARLRKAGKGLVDEIATGKTQLPFHHSSVAERNRLDYVRESQRLRNDRLGATLASLDNFMGATVLSLRAIEGQLNPQQKFLVILTEIATRIPQSNRKRVSK